MAERRKTPDILADLLGTSSSGLQTAETAASKSPASNSHTPSDSSPLLVPASSNLTSQQQNGKTERQQNGKPVKQGAAKQNAGKTANWGASARAAAPLQGSESESQAVSRILPETEDGEDALGEAENGETESKVKVTFYLSEDAVELLEDAQRTLRRLARGQGRNGAPKSLTSKSALLEEALKLACQDIETNGPDSQLARKVF